VTFQDHMNNNELEMTSE